MKRTLVWILCALMCFYCTTSPVWGGEKVLKMSTTTSTQASGLLDILLPEFEKDPGIRVKVIAKGTGAAIRDGMDGNVDVIFVHAKAREEAFVAEGYGTRRHAVMHNDFIIIGPTKNLAGVRRNDTATAAFKKIAAKRQPFISRGDDSGTHTKEQALWKASGLPLENESTTIAKKGKARTISFLYPAGLGSWYFSIGQGMGKTITYAEEKQAYTLADRGTYIRYKFGREGGLDLDICCEGDPGLHNPYGVIPINPKKFPHVQYDMAKTFAEWLVSPRGQYLINDYRLLGKQLFYPDAM
ncbi:Tungstate ABC transporter, substrate-binding protein [Olavius algarvensis associated proteobacterium Delta 3]|nr:Tungstate ABC transporter, substrate-binding protein [Olavius algarvensis associated proteobacterium Delta 3]